METSRRDLSSIFQSAQGGLAAGSFGPVRVDDISGYCVLAVTAVSGESIESLAARIIESSGEKPARPKHLQPSQLFSIFDRVRQEGRKTVIIVKDAHNLNEEHLYGLKRIREGRVGFDRGRAGVLLCSDRPDEFERLFHKCPELWPWTVELGH